MDEIGVDDAYFSKFWEMIQKIVSAAPHDEPVMLSFATSACERLKNAL